MNSDDELSQAMQRRMKRAACQLPIEESSGRRERLLSEIEQFHAPVSSGRSQRFVWIRRRAELVMAITAMLLMGLVISSEYLSFDNRGERLSELSGNAQRDDRKAQAESEWQTIPLGNAHSTSAESEGRPGTLETPAEPRACDWLAVELQSILKPSRLDWTEVKQAIAWPVHASEQDLTVHPSTSASRNGEEDDLSMSIVSAGVGHVAFEVGDRPLVELAVSLLGR